MWLLLSAAWLIAVALCLAAILGGIWQFPPLALPVIYLAWRGFCWVQRVARGVRALNGRAI